MEEHEAEATSREIIKDKLRQCFDGKIVRKDLTKKIKEGAGKRPGEVYLLNLEAELPNLPLLAHTEGVSCVAGAP